MKKILALIALCLIVLGIGYGYFYLTGDNTVLIVCLALLASVACMYLIGLIIWLLEYIGKN